MRISDWSSDVCSSDLTEAMTTVDVNTGAYIGHRNLEETVLKTNLEAAQAIARQLRLRNFGGIIILDFIDMKSADYRAQVLRSEEHTSELQSLMRISYAVFCLKTKKRKNETTTRVS